MSFEIADEWAVGFDDDFVLVAVVDYRFLLIPWMELWEDMEVSVYITTIEDQLRDWYGRIWRSGEMSK